MNDFLTCPHCQTSCPRGAIVCPGCQAEITYGASEEQIRRWGGAGALLLFALASLLLRPFVTGAQPSAVVVVVCLVVGLGLPLLGGYLGVKMAKRKYRDQHGFHRDFVPL